MHDKQKLVQAEASAKPRAIAIVGMGCRFPGGASSPEQYWQNLIAGKDCLSETPANRYNAPALLSEDKNKKGRLYAGRGGYIDGFDEFDPAFFGIAPREADSMDPQQRKLLEVSWEALEDAGQKPFALAGQPVGVFMGAFTLDYKIVQFGDPTYENLGSHTATGVMMTMVSNRISYVFDFRGPSMSVDTACSSSLVAVHLACQSLRAGDSKLALAGGVLLHCTPQYTVSETKGGFLSPQGRSCTFDASANGYVRAEGAGVVVLKLLDDALRDGDRVHAVILGSGVNQDGHTNGITVPNADAQKALIRKIYSEAGVHPREIQYVEAHGTSTPVGDPIEANALGEVFGSERAPDSRFFIGSVKTNIGHTEAAAGVAGLIKTVMCLKNKQIAPHINFREINPKIKIDEWGFGIPTSLTPWPDHVGPARAGVNSFGFGGTNAHVLVQEAPDLAATKTQIAIDGLADAEQTKTLRLLPLSASSEDALPELATRMLELIDSDAAPALDDIAHTLARHRQHLDWRQSFLYRDEAELRDALAAAARGDNHPRVTKARVRDARKRKLAWVFTGMGPQWWGMGRELFATEPVFRAMVERCDAEMSKLTSWSLIEELHRPEAESKMAQTWLAQPANFAMQVALAALWRARGLEPEAIIGHSAGEAAAFYEAGAYTFEDAVAVIIHRSRLQHLVAGTGTMMAVGLSASEVEPLIAPYGDQLSIAAMNSPTAVTVAGAVDALNALAPTLKEQGVFHKLLRVEIPYHSAFMQPIHADLMESLASIRPRATNLPVYLTARPQLADGTELDAQYWWENVRFPVHFASAVERMIEDGYSTFLEIGPHPVLASSINEVAAKVGVEVSVHTSVRRAEPEQERFYTSLGELFNLGYSIEWRRVSPEGQLVSLPTYPWRRDRYWVESDFNRQVRLAEIDHPMIGRRVAGLLPTWERVIDVEREPYLEGHAIQDSIVYPAAGYIEMVGQAMRAFTAAGAWTIRDLALKKALFLAEPKRVRLQLSQENGAFQIASLSESGEPAVHTTGVCRQRNATKRAASADIAAIRQYLSSFVEGIDCYDRLAQVGYQYGPSFQGIKHVWVGRREALACIELGDELKSDAERAHAHPSIVDAAFQALLAAELCGEGVDLEQAKMRLPVGIDELSIDALGSARIYAHAKCEEQADGALTGDIHLYFEDGRPAGEILGFSASLVDEVAGSVSLSTIDGWLMKVDWVPRDHLLEDVSAMPEGASQWLVWRDQGGLADRLAMLLRSRGLSCCLVENGTEFLVSDDGRRASIDFGRDDHVASLLSSFEQRGTAVSGIVHMANLDIAPGEIQSREQVVAARRHGNYSMLAIAKALGTSEARLFTVTRGAHALPMDTNLCPLAASAWGIGRVLAYQETPSNRGKLIDLEVRGQGAEQHETDARWILAELTRDDGEDEIAYRGDSRFSSRLAKIDDLTRPVATSLRADGSYIVTGAFGALGKLVCKLLIKRGARHLVLMGRGAVPPRQEWLDAGGNSRVATIRELESLGAHVITASIDVTDEVALANWHREHRAMGYPVVRGVFHSAGLVRDTLASAMTWETFDLVYEPKVLGALNLARELADEPLEHFVIFSSIACLMTTAGQTNYAAGNAFLDALAHQLRLQGRPALSVNWGPWAVGMIEDLGLADHYRNKRGMTCLSAEAGMGVLDRLMDQDIPQAVVSTVVDWPTFLAWYPHSPPLVADVAQHTVVESGGENCFLDEFRNAADDATRLQLASDRLLGTISDVMRIPRADLRPESSLNELGLDSLMAIDLRHRVTVDVGVSLTVVMLLSGGPLEQLVAKVFEMLSEQLGGDEDEIDPNAAPVVVYENTKEYPLTYNQKAIWFLKQLSPESYAYNIGGAIEIRPDIDPALIQRAVRTVIARHPSLRANFFVRDGQPVQRITDEVRDDFAVKNVEGWSWDELYAHMIDEYRRPYDLENDPMLRIRLFRRGPDRIVLMAVVYHIISDAISVFTFIEEVLALCHAYREGRELTLPQLRASYLDFLNAQNRFLGSTRAAKSLEYWKSALPESVPVLNLPTDKTRPTIQTQNGASLFFDIPTQTTSQVHEMAQRSGSTVFVVLLSAYYTLLHRYSNQNDIIVGSPVTGRTREEFSNVYGYFVNPLPLYANFDGDPTFSALVDQVRGTVLGGLDNQEYPFALLVEKLGLQHDPGRSAVFQAMFILLVHRVAAEKFGCSIDYIGLPEEEGQFDLTLSAYEDVEAGVFRCVIKYNTDLFVASTIERFAQHYRTLLARLTSEPNHPVSSYDLHTDAERARLLETYARSVRPLPTPRPHLHQIVEQFARNTPDAVAVRVAGSPGSLTYGQLDDRAESIGAALQSAGVQAGDVVGVSLPKSLDLPAALMAIHKVGGAYVPLDSSYPDERIEAMLTSAGVRHLIISGDLERYESFDVCKVDLSQLDDSSRARPVESHDDQLAYVIYTSGTTGTPKGVCVGRGAQAAMLASWRQEYSLDTGPRVHLQMASFSFDVFTGDLTRALGSGGTLVLCPREVLLDSGRLYQTLRDERIETGEFVPAIMRGLMRHCLAADLDLSFMRLVIVGSDIWKVDEYERLRALCGPLTRVINSYGITECTVDSTYFEGSTEGMEGGRVVPIGRAFPGANLYVLDSRMQLAPIGVPGELYIGGQALAQGYVRDEALTATKFIEHSFDGAESVRLYKTGDVVSWDDRGRLQLHGRADNQVKIRGFRIEVSEIETHLVSAPEIEHGIVVVRTDSRGEASLSAYYTVRAEHSVTRHDLREHLSRRLPPFMVPASLIQLEAFPTNASGKIDVKALPIPAEDAAVESFAPQLPFEEKMAELWQIVLGARSLSRQSDFFEIGGSSIKLIELIHHIGEHLNVSVPVSLLFQRTTLSGMAQVVNDAVTGKLDNAKPFIVFNERASSTLFCFPPAGGYGIVYRLLAKEMPSVRFVCFHYLEGHDKVSRYADLIEGSGVRAPYQLFGYSLGGNLAFEVCRELERRYLGVESITIMDSYRIHTSFEFTDAMMDSFRAELTEHFQKHTGSDAVHESTFAQAEEYIRFCSKRPNLGKVQARVGVISDENKTAFYQSGGEGSWAESSATESTLLTGSGKHEDMLDASNVGTNAGLLRRLVSSALEPVRTSVNSERELIEAALGDAEE